jgi:hypothetical protein
VKMYVWSRKPAFIAVAQADSVEAARAALLLEIGGSDGSCEFRQEAVDSVTNRTPRTIWSGINAEFAITDSAELQRCDRERQELRDALRLAINTVECASVDIRTGEELPWYKTAKRLLGTVPS